MDAEEGILWTSLGLGVCLGRTSLPGLWEAVQAVSACEAPVVLLQARVSAGAKTSMAQAKDARRSRVRGGSTSSSEERRDNNPDYYRKYRESNPDYVKKNRQRQRERNALRKERSGPIARTDAVKGRHSSCIGDLRSRRVRWGPDCKDGLDRSRNTYHSEVLSGRGRALPMIAKNDFMVSKASFVQTGGAWNTITPMGSR